MSIFENFVFLCIVIFTSPEGLHTSNEITWTPDQMIPLPGACCDFGCMYRNFLYIDKTSFIQHLVEERLCFLVRPPAFGKTVFLQMIKYFYKGDDCLFQGLYVYQYGNVEWMRNILPHNKKNTTSKWLQFPVIHLNFENNMVFRTYKGFADGTYRMLRTIASDYDVKHLPGKLSISDLIKLLYNKFKLPVVLLVDQYDSPYRRAKFSLEDHELAETLLKFYRQFYNQIRDSASQLGFALVMGVLYVPMDSIGSSPNDFHDLTYSSKMANAFGFTEDEIKSNFGYHIYKFAKWRVNEFVKGSNTTVEPKLSEVETVLNELIQKSDGYQFDIMCKSKKVLNVMSIILSLKRENLRAHWLLIRFALVLIKQLYKSKRSLMYYKNGARISKNCFLQLGNSSMSSMPLEMQLLIYGYLTIAGFDETVENQEVILKFPNEEIEAEIEEYLIEYGYSVRKKSLSITCPIDLRVLFDLYSNSKIQHAMLYLSKFKFQSYNYFWEDNAMTTNEISKQLGALFKYEEIGNVLNVEFLKENSSDLAGSIDLLIFDLLINVAIKIVPMQKKTSSVEAIRQLIGYYENHRIPFMKAMSNPEVIRFLGLHYEFVDNTTNLKLQDWIHLPYYNGQLQMRHMKFSSYKIKENFWKVYNASTSNLVKTDG